MNEKWPRRPANPHLRGLPLNLFISLLPIGLAILILGCSGQTQSTRTATPQPTQQVLLIGIAPEALPAMAGLEACRNEVKAALIVEEIAEQSTLPDEFDLYITLGLPPNPSPHIAPLASDELVLVVPSENGGSSPLDIDTIRAIFTGQTIFWSEVPDGGRLGSGQIDLWNYPPDHPLREIIERVVLGPNSEVLSNAMLAPNPKRMSEAVAEEPGRIGYLPAAWTHAGLSQLTLEPDPGKQFILPVLISSSEKFEGAGRVLVDCLQNGPGEKALMEIYSPWDGN